MRTQLVLALLAAASTAGGGTAPQPVAARMRHVMFHVGYGAVLDVDDLRGHLTSRTSGPPTFDDINGYQVNIDYAQVSMTPESLSNLMNRYVFVRAEAPLKNVSVEIDGDELVQKGTLHKGLDVPFTMHATVAVTPDGKLRLHPTSLKAAGFLGKRVLDFFGLELERLIKSKPEAGLTVEGDDLLLDPERIVPPPQIRGHVSKVWLKNGSMFMQFGDPKRPGITPPAGDPANYMYYRGGTLRFGKLTMEDTDLLLVDADPSDPFDFSPAEYNVQLVAGFSKNTKSKGLMVYMPDADDAAKGRTAETALCREATTTR